MRWLTILHRAKSDDGVTLSVPLALIKPGVGGALRISGAGTAGGKSGAVVENLAAKNPAATACRYRNSRRNSGEEVKPSDTGLLLRCQNIYVHRSSWMCRWMHSASNSFPVHLLMNFWWWRTWAPAGCVAQLCAVAQRACAQTGATSSHCCADRFASGGEGAYHRMDAG